MDLLPDLNINCPYCGELIVVSFDAAEGDYSTIDDCAVCCRPIQILVRCEGGKVVGLDVSSE